jgi:hypothetical protein
MNKHQAILATYSNVVVTRGNDAFDAEGNQVNYDEASVQAYIDANAYKAKRAAEYPAIVDQLDLLYHGGMDAWKTAIQAVKDKYPKG